MGVIKEENILKPEARSGILAPRRPQFVFPVGMEINDFHFKVTVGAQSHLKVVCLWKDRKESELKPLLYL